MPQSLAAVYVHVVFSTKDRVPTLADPLLRMEAHAYLAGTCNELGCTSLEVGGVADHVHLLVRQSRTVSLADLVRELKSNSSAWLKRKGVVRFGWQQGYGAFSVDVGSLDQVRLYIRNQEEHHREFDFRTEFLRLLEQHSLEWDERYVWD